MRYLLFVFLSSTHHHVRPWELVRYSVWSHFRKAERRVSGESLQSSHLPHPMSPERNKAAIVNSPNFTAACRNPVLLFSFSSTSTLCWDQSGLSCPQKPEALASSSFSTGFDTPQLPAIQTPAPCNLFPFVKQQYPSQKKMLAQHKVCENIVSSTQNGPETTYLLAHNKTTLNNLHHFQLLQILVTLFFSQLPIKHL